MCGSEEMLCKAWSRESTHELLMLPKLAWILLPSNSDTWRPVTFSDFAHYVYDTMSD